MNRIDEQFVKEEVSCDRIKNCGLSDVYNNINVWPSMNSLGLNDVALEERRRGIGGSDANILLSGDPMRILHLWREKRREAPTENLRSVLPVMMGLWTETFNRHWYEMQTHLAVTDVGLVAISSTESWRRATLDGYVEDKSAIWEAKHVSAFSKPEDILTRYMPQLQHNIAVMGADSAILSVLYGNHKWECYEVAADWMYQEELLEAERAFWACVLDGREPCAAPPPPAPKPIGVREVCFASSNAWAVAAADWLAHGDAAKKHTQAVKTLKDLIEDDVARAYGHGIEAKRSKAGAISIREWGQ